MEFDSAAIGEFKELYYQEYGIVLTDEEAVEYATRLIQLVRAVYGRGGMMKDKILDYRIKK